MVSIDSNEVIAKFGDHPIKERASWEWLKTQPIDITMEIGVTEKESGNKRHAVSASFNTHTGVLSVEGTAVGTLHKNPVDVVLSTFDHGNTQLVPIAESVIWEYVNKNPQLFIRGENG